MFTISIIIIAIVAYFVLSKALNWDTDKQVKYITYATLIIIAIAFIRFEMWLFDGSGSYDSDNDGLSNQFEEEQGLDPNDYTSNWEW